MLPLILLAIAGVFMVNRHFQFKYVYEEISKKTEKALKKELNDMKKKAGRAAATKAKKIAM